MRYSDARIERIIVVCYISKAMELDPVEDVYTYARS